MLKHFETLCGLCAVPGDETAVRDYIIDVLKEIPSVSWQIDPLGSLIVQKKGKNPAPHKLMISAHMDEVGMIITYVNSDGTLCVSPVGGVDASVVIGRQVLVGKDHIHGVIGTKPVHLLSQEEKESLPKFSKLVLDIGAKNGEDAKKLVFPGDRVYFLPDFRMMGGNRVCSKAIDDRAARCAPCPRPSRSGADGRPSSG